MDSAAVYNLKVSELSWFVMSCASPDEIAFNWLSPADAYMRQ